MLVDGYRMIKQLLTLFVILTITVSTATPPFNPAYDAHCWEPDPTILPAVFKGCVEAIDTVTNGHDPSEVLKFSLDPALKPDIKFPRSWEASTDRCLVGLQYKLGATGFDRTTLLDVKRAAMAAAMSCVIQPHTWEERW